MDNLIKAVNDVDRKLGKIAAITAKGNLGVKDVIKMASKGRSIEKTMDKAIAGYKAKPGSTPEQSAQLMAAMEVLQPKQEAQMANARAMKPNFDKLHIAGLVKKNMEKGESTQTGLAQIVVDTASEADKPKALEMQARGNKNFQETMALYSNATGGEEEADKIADDSD